MIFEDSFPDGDEIVVLVAAGLQKFYPLRLIENLLCNDIDQRCLADPALAVNHNVLASLKDRVYDPRNLGAATGE
jgi:hypothetical protein